MSIPTTTGPALSHLSVHCSRAQAHRLLAATRLPSAQPAVLPVAAHHEERARPTLLASNAKRPCLRRPEAASCKPPRFIQGRPVAAAPKVPGTCPGGAVDCMLVPPRALSAHAVRTPVSLGTFWIDDATSGSRRRIAVAALLAMRSYDSRPPVLAAPGEHEHGAKWFGLGLPGRPKRCGHGGRS